MSKIGPVPVTSGLDNPILRAVSKPVENFAERLNLKLVQKPVEKLTEKLVGKPVQKPVLNLAGKSVEKSAEKSMEKSSGDTAAEISKLLKIMHATMKKDQGIGIAAPQVGVNLRIALAKLNSNTKDEKIITMVNPEILNRSLRTQKDQEGCLSLREKWGEVTRSESLTVVFFDENWTENRLHLSGLNARIIQHEVDHLDGILFWDRVKDRKEI